MFTITLKKKNLPCGSHSQMDNHITNIYGHPSVKTTSSVFRTVTVVEKMVRLSKYDRSTEVNQFPDSKFKISYRRTHFHCYTTVSNVLEK